MWSNQRTRKGGNLIRQLHHTIFPEELKPQRRLNNALLQYLHSLTQSYHKLIVLSIGNLYVFLANFSEIKLVSGHRLGNIGR